MKRRMIGQIAAATAAFLGGGMASAQSAAPVDPAAMSATVKELASDAYQGRAPGTAGEARTVAYLVERLKGIGVEPAGDNGGFTQAVPLIRTRIGVPAAMSVATPKGRKPLVQSRDIYVGTVRPVERLSIKDVPMVFVGYGVHAPERGWDDFKGIDLHGKIAVFLVNDPDYGAMPGDPVAGKFGGKRMTYYGRWTYKFEEAARQGAVGALIVHETLGAGYGWSTVIAPGGENYDVVRGPGDQRVLLQGWLDRDAAHALFTAAGLDFEQQRTAAHSPAFRPIALPERLSVEAPVTVERVTSRNVLGKLTGTAHPDETVMFGAHWDAYGVGPADAAGRTVRAGAADDAIGVAGVLELARAFKAAPRTQRTLVFALWTGEERNLLGSETYAAHPPFSLEKTVANLTMDVLQTAGPAKDVVLVGNGQSGLDAYLARAAAGQGRTITPEALPERGLYFRADHFSVARRGVPSLLLMGMSGGHDLVTGGRAAGDAWLDGYMTCYHQACDTWSPTWDLRGAAADVDLLYSVGRTLADSRAWPDWSPGSEFKALRDASAAVRAAAQ